jgi:TPR repeat protein
MKWFRSVVLSIAAVASAVCLSPVVPPLSVGMNFVGTSLAHAGLGQVAGFWFSILHRVGDLTATNNLGVACWCRWTPCPTGETPRSLFEKAHAAAVGPAAFNLALSLPADSDSPDDQVKLGLDVLGTAVVQGDVHAGVLLANRLYFKSRGRFVPARDALKLELLRTAAATGDRGYVFLLAEELLQQARGRDLDVGRVGEALTLFAKVDSLGDDRGAKEISNVLDHVVRTEHLRHLPSEVTALSALEWSRRAARTGRISHVCAYSAKLVDSTGDSLEPETLKALGEVVPHLRTCAEARGSEPVYAPPVGNVAMYARRLFGGVTALSTSPGHAAMTLGKMYETGRGVPRDLDVARQHYRSAAEVHGFAEAREKLQGL